MNTKIDHGSTLFLYFNTIILKFLTDSVYLADFCSDSRSSLRQFNSMNFLSMWSQLKHSIKRFIASLDRAIVGLDWHMPLFVSFNVRKWSKLLRTILTFQVFYAQMNFVVDKEVCSIFKFFTAYIFWSAVAYIIFKTKIKQNLLYIKRIQFYLPLSWKLKLSWSLSYWN